MPENLQTECFRTNMTKIMKVRIRCLGEVENGKYVLDMDLRPVQGNGSRLLLSRRGKQTSGSTFQFPGEVSSLVGVAGARLKRIANALLGRKQYRIPPGACTANHVSKKITLYFFLHILIGSFKVGFGFSSTVRVDSRSGTEIQ